MAKADCPQCNGTGWKLVARAEHASSSGRPPVFAVPCECSAEDRATHVLDRARIPPRYGHCDFENFDTNPYDQDAEGSAYNRSLAQAKLVVEAFARDYPVGIEHGLLLMGPCGVGKTHLAVAGLKEIVLRGHQGLFYDYSELLKEIQVSYNPEYPATEMGVLEPVLEAEVLLLDGLGGVSKPSLWALDTIGHILNTRYNAKRLTLITTNYLDPEFKQLPDSQTAPLGVSPRGKDGPPGSMNVVTLPSGELMAIPRKETFEDRIGKHIRSRLYEMCRTVEIVAPDYRKEIRQARPFHA